MSLKKSCCRAMSDIFNCSGINTDAFTPSIYKIKRVQVVVCDGNRYRGFHSAVSEEEKDQNLGRTPAFQD